MIGKLCLKIKNHFQNSSILKTSSLLLEDVASQTIQIEHCPAYLDRMVQFDLHDFSHVDRHPFLNWETANWSVYGYLLDHVVVDGFYKAFFKDGTIITDSNSWLGTDVLQSLTVDPERLVSYEDQGLVFSCGDHWEENYYHWMAHAIPAFYAAKKSGFKGKYLLPASLQSWQRRTLELLGIDLTNSLQIEKDKQYLFSQVYYTEYTKGKADYLVSALRKDAYEQMVHAVGNIPLASQLHHDKIYISRLSKDNRHLENEKLLIQQLQDKGYFILNPEEYTIDEQINLFQQAKMVVALLGAGLANIVFCRPSTIIYELIPSHHKNPCFLAMSLQQELRYWADNFHTGIDHNQPDHLSAWAKELDIKAVMDRVCELERFL